MAKVKTKTKVHQAAGPKVSTGLGTRRSPCPVACALDLLGDRWTLLVIRDLFLGRTRFRDFVASPENIPTNILSDRLERLLQHQIVEQIPADDGTKRLGYGLTRKGQALGPVLAAMRDWGLAWEKQTRVLTTDHRTVVDSGDG
jgi:DNA-binding HxlR family transcriptional regulator